MGDYSRRGQSDRKCAASPAVANHLAQFSRRRERKPALGGAPRREPPARTLADNRQGHTRMDDEVLHLHRSPPGCLCRLATKPRLPNVRALNPRGTIASRKESAASAWPKTRWGFPGAVKVGGEARPRDDVHPASHARCGESHPRAVARGLRPPLVLPAFTRARATRDVSSQRQ